MSSDEVPERANILLVDDKPARLLSYEACLERLDQNLVRALSGQEALEQLERMEFAAILLDVSMPHMDGFETAARIRADPRLAQTPIIFVTGVHITDFDRLRGYEMGAADYVYVPVVPEILRGKVQVLVQLYLQRRELARLNEQLAEANGELARAHAQLKAENTRELQKLNRNLERANARLVSEVAERKRAEFLLKEAARRKDEFISILGHELRNPLAAMQSGIELLRLTPLPVQKVPWARDLLQRQLRHLKRLIDDLLDVSRITTGRIQLRCERLSLGQVLGHSVDATRPLLDERQHELTMDLPDEPLYIDGDAVRLTQVFGNLLSNAAKYTERGGKIRLSAAIEEGTPRTAVISVSDTGSGIPQDMLEQIFELFAQVDRRDSRSQGGLGIGLALVRALVELHSGSVSARSEGPGRGAEFLVRLPMLESQEQPREERRKKPAPPASTSLRLLIVDDNTDLANGLAMYLGERAGFDVRVAYTGERGVRTASDFAPHAVLLDIGLPDIDGFEVARRLRHNPRLRHVLLIAISGFSGEQDKQRAAHAGFDRYFVKPVSYETLQEFIRTRLAPASCTDGSA